MFQTTCGMTSSPFLSRAVGLIVFVSAAMPARAQSYADSLAVLEALGAALREDARTVIQRFACYDGMHPCRTPQAVLPDPLLAAFAEHAGAQLVNESRATIPPCPWGWDTPSTRPGYQIGVARVTLSGDTARVLILKHCDNAPGYLHDIFGQDDEYTLTRHADGSWVVRAQKMMRITRARDHGDVAHVVLDSWRCRGAGFQGKAGAAGSTPA